MIVDGIGIGVRVALQGSGWSRWTLALFGWADLGLRLSDWLVVVDVVDSQRSHHVDSLSAPAMV
jgi:hypothetical protein